MRICFGTCRYSTVCDFDDSFRSLVWHRFPIYIESTFCHIDGFAPIPQSGKNNNLFQSYAHIILKVIKKTKSKENGTIKTFLQCLKPIWQLKICKGSYVSCFTQFSEEGMVGKRYNPLYEVGVLSQCYVIRSCYYLQTINMKVYIIFNCQHKVQINYQ